MRVFVAGGTGVIGRRLVPQLVARGHQVTATTTSAGKLGLLEQLGAEGVVMDGLAAASVGEAVAAARPDAIVNQMTALSVAHAGKPNLRKPDRFFATTPRQTYFRSPTHADSNTMKNPSCGVESSKHTKTNSCLSRQPRPDLRKPCRRRRGSGVLASVCYSRLT